MYKSDTTLAINPIHFISMGHNGNPGKTGDTSDIFTTRLKQNIAYACYHEPKTLEEIAREIGVPAVYIADELTQLVEYAYIDQMDNSKNPKYRTNMVIHDSRLFQNQSKDMETSASIYKPAAEKISVQFFSKIFADFEADPAHWGFTCPGNDTNFMKYNLVMGCIHFLSHKEVEKEYDQYRVKRPDGGNFIAHAAVSDDCHKDWNKPYPYWTCGFMGRGEDNFCSLQTDCRYTKRDGGWTDNLNSDWESLVRFIHQDCTPSKISLEEYKRLCDKGYIEQDIVQVMTIPGCSCHFWTYLEPFMEPYKALTESLHEYHREIDEKMHRLSKDCYPLHIQPINKLYNTNTLSNNQFIPFLLEAMLENGMLKPLTETQKKAALSVLCYV